MLCTWHPTGTLLTTVAPHARPQAYLEGDESVIKEHCSPQMIERLTGIIHVQREQARLRVCD